MDECVQLHREGKVLLKIVKPLLPQIALILFGCLILIITSYQVEITKSSGYSPRALPYFAGITIIILSLFTLISTVLKEKKTNRSVESQQQEIEKKNYFRVAVVFIFLVLWTVLLEYLGFLITTFLLVISVMYMMGVKKISSLVITSGLFSIVIYIVFKMLLKISLPEGIFL